MGVIDRDGAGALCLGEGHQVGVEAPEQQELPAFSQTVTRSEHLPLKRLKKRQLEYCLTSLLKAPTRARHAKAVLQIEKVLMTLRQDKAKQLRGGADVASVCGDPQRT